MGEVMLHSKSKFGSIYVAAVTVIKSSWNFSQTISYKPPAAMKPQTQQKINMTQEISRISQMQLCGNSLVEIRNQKWHTKAETIIPMQK